MLAFHVFVNVLKGKKQDFEPQFLPSFVLSSPLSLFYLGKTEKQLYRCSFVTVFLRQSLFALIQFVFFIPVLFRIFYHLNRPQKR